MTAASAPWWFCAIVFTLAVSIVMVPSRVEVLRWRHRRSEQGRLEQAELVAGHLAAKLTRDPVFVSDIGLAVGHLAAKLTRDPVFVSDIGLAVAQALDELGISRDGTAPAGQRLRLAANRPPRDPRVVQDLNDAGYLA